MGVPGLSSFLQGVLGRRPVNLAELVGPRRRHFLVDGPSLAFALYGAAGLDWACGGQWQEYYDAVAALVRSFAAMGAVVVAFFERGVPLCKLPEKLRRCKELGRRAEALLRDPGCIGRGGGGRDAALLPFVVEALIGALQTHGAQVCFCAGEADLAIAQYYARDPGKVAAVLTADSDFFVLPCDVVVDVNTIQWPAALRGGSLVADFVVHHHQVEAALGTPHLSMFAVLAGCDYTAPISYYLHISAGWSGAPAPTAEAEPLSDPLPDLADDVEEPLPGEDDLAGTEETEEAAAAEAEVVVEVDRVPVEEPVAAAAGRPHRFSAVIGLLQTWQPGWAPADFLRSIAERVCFPRRETFLTQATRALAQYSPLPGRCPRLYAPTHRPPLGRAVVRYPALEAPQGLSADALAQDLVLLAEWLGHGTREVAVYRATGAAPEPVAQVVRLPQDLPFPNLPRAEDGKSAKAAFRYAAAAAAMYAAGPPTLPAAVALPLRVATLALCYLATHPQRAVLRTVAELDCLALQCVLCYRGTRLRIGHLAEAKSWWCVTCELLVLAKERRQHLAQYHAKQSLSVSTAFQPADAVKVYIQGLKPGTTRDEVRERLLRVNGGSVVDVQEPRPLTAAFRVDFGTVDDATRAAAAVSGRCLAGRLLSVTPLAAAGQEQGPPTSLLLGNVALDTGADMVRKLVAGFSPIAVSRTTRPALRRCVVTLATRAGAEAVVQQLSLEEGLRCRIVEPDVLLNVQCVRLGLHFQATLYAVADLLKALGGPDLVDVHRLFDGVTLQALVARMMRGEDVAADAPPEFAAVKASVLAVLKDPLATFLPPPPN